MGTLADVFVRVRGTTDQLGKDIDKGSKAAGKKGGESFKSSFGGAIKGLGTLFAGLAIGGFLKDTISEARESIRVGNITAAVIKSTGGAAKITAANVGNLATAISNVTGTDDELIQSGENILLTFTRIRNETGRGNDIFDKATVAATNLAAAMNNGAVTADGLKTASIQVGKALNDPLKGMTALQKVGVTFSDQQKKQIAAFVKSGNIMGAQKVILAELGKEFGGVAAAAADPAQKMQVAWANLKEYIGLQLIPIINKLLPQFQALIPKIEAITSSILQFSTTNSAILSIADTIKTIVVAVNDWLSHNQTLRTVLLALTVAMWALDVAMDANPIGLVVIAIAALVVAIVWVATKTRFFQTVWGAVWGFMKAVGAWFAGPFAGFFVAVWNKIVSFLRPIFPLFAAIFGLVISVVKTFVAFWGAVWAVIWLVVKTVWGFIRPFVVTEINIVRTIITTVINYIRNIWTTYWNIIKAVIQAVWPPIVAIVKGAVARVIAIINEIKAIVDKVRGFFNQLRGAAEGGVGSLISFVKSIPGKITGALANLGGLLVHSGEQIIQGLINGINNMVGKVKDAISSVLKKARDLLPFSPAKEGPFSGKGWTLYSGEAMMSGLAEGIRGNSPATLGAMNAAVRALHATGVAAQAGASTGGGLTFSPTYHVAGDLDEQRLAKATVQRLLFSLATGAT